MMTAGACIFDSTGMLFLLWFVMIGILYNIFIIKKMLQTLSMKGLWGVNTLYQPEVINPLQPINRQIEEIADR